MCVVIDRHDLHFVFKDDIALLEVFQGPPDRKPSFQRHLKVLFIHKLPSNQKSAVAQAHDEARFDDVTVT